MSTIISQSTPLVAFSERRPLRLAYFVSHPIQYQALLLRRLAKENDIDLTVFFSSNISVRGCVDPGFGVPVKWDVPVLEGYRSESLPVLKDTERLGPWKPLNYGIRRAQEAAAGNIRFLGFRNQTELPRF